MLPTALILEIDRLLREGQLSHRQIASQLGVSRGTVSALAGGHRGLYGREPLDARDPLTPSSPPTRCPRCGYRVYLPCLICSTREYKEEQQRKTTKEQRGSLRGIFRRFQVECNGEETAAMVSISFPDREAEKRALAFLLGRFSGRVLQSGEHLVPKAALEALAQQDIPFSVKGKATYEQQLAAIRGSATSSVQ